MRICFIPIDNRPVCYNLAVDICAIDRDIELLIPPREYLGDLTKSANVDAIFEWFKGTGVNANKIILSLDTIAYGGLIPSRRSNDKKDVVLERVKRFRDLWSKSGAKVYALSSIMRISNNNYNEEEKEYWKDYGEKIFRWSYDWDKNNAVSFCHPELVSGSYKCGNTNIPQEILDDYIATRRRNFEINQTFLEWQKEGFFDELIFTKDDCAEFGLNIRESKFLQSEGARVITGADEVPLSLLSKAIDKKLKVQPVFIEPEYRNLVSNYEDVSIENCVLNQLKLAEIEVVDKNADIILVVNNFKDHQGEIVMERPTEQFSGTFTLPDKPYMIADVRNANGADNNFVECVLPQIRLDNFYGYSAWNTSANTIGTLLCIAKLKFQAKNYNVDAFKNVEMIRFLDDWAYQANVRQYIKKCHPELVSGSNENLMVLKNQFSKYETRIKEVLQLDNINNDYIYPWNRYFEIEVINNGNS